jgi:hypothetical protein
VTILYRTFLGRPAGSRGLAAWPTVLPAALRNVVGTGSLPVAEFHLAALCGA